MRRGRQVSSRGRIKLSDYCSFFLLQVWCALMCKMLLRVRCFMYLTLKLLQALLNPKGGKNYRIYHIKTLNFIY